jgi:hypothetical protein
LLSNPTSLLPTHFVSAHVPIDVVSTPTDVVSTHGSTDALKTQAPTDVVTTESPTSTTGNGKVDLALCFFIYSLI